MCIAVARVFVVVLMLCGMGLANAQAAPFAQDSRYFPHYTHTTVHGTPSVTTSARGMIYIRHEGRIYRITPLSNGEFWVGKAWTSLQQRIEADHAAAIIDIPAGADPVTMIIDGQRVSFPAAQLFSNAKSLHVRSTGGGTASSSSSSGGSGSTSSSGSSSSGSAGGACPPGQQRGVGGSDCHQVRLCEITHTCTGGGSSGSSSSSGGSSSSSGSTSSGGSSSSGGSTSGSSSGGPTGPLPPPPAQCHAASAAATVTPSNFSSAVNGLGAGRTIVLAPGNYPAMNISGKSFGGATIQCAQPGACKFGNSKLTNVSGLTIDGILIQGGSVALDLESAQNVTVRCSTFKETTGSGILLFGGTGQVKFHNNTFYSAKIGCSFNNKNGCTTVAGGLPVAEMDYGIRIHKANYVEMLGNRFTGPNNKGLYNHSISLKESVANAVITGNIFDACGRNCIEPGQQANTTAQPNISCGTATITGNTFNNMNGGAIVLVKNIHTVVFSNNTFNNSPKHHVVMYTFTSDPRHLGTPINGGVPSDRRVIGTDAGR